MQTTNYSNAELNEELFTIIEERHNDVLRESAYTPAHISATPRHHKHVHKTLVLVKILAVVLMVTAIAISNKICAEDRCSLQREVAGVMSREGHDRAAAAYGETAVRDVTRAVMDGEVAGFHWESGIGIVTDSYLLER